MKHRTQASLIASLAVAICIATPAAHAETKTAMVSPGKTEVIEFDGDPSGLYQLNIQATSGHTINESDFTAEFKSNTLWQRESKTSYNITYTENPKPPGVSVKGDFERSGGGGGGGYSPNYFLVNVPNVDCEPEDRELVVFNAAARSGPSVDVFFGPNTDGTKSLWLARMEMYALWKKKDYDCEFNVGVVQNARLIAYIKYSDDSSIGVSTTAYLLDGRYPDKSVGSGVFGGGGPRTGKNYKFTYDRPSVSIGVLEEMEFVTEVHYTLEAENYFMLLPEQGPPVSRMIVAWSSSGTVTRVNGELKLTAHSSSPSVAQIENAAAESERPPVSQGETANVFVNSRWKRLSGGPDSLAAEYLSKYNGQ